MLARYSQNLGFSTENLHPCLHRKHKRTRKAVDGTGTPFRAGAETALGLQTHARTLAQKTGGKGSSSCNLKNTLILESAPPKPRFSSK